MGGGDWHRAPWHEEQPHLQDKGSYSCRMQDTRTRCTPHHTAGVSSTLDTIASSYTYRFLSMFGPCLSSTALTDGGTACTSLFGFIVLFAALRAKQKGLITLSPPSKGWGNQWEARPYWLPPLAAGACLICCLPDIALCSERRSLHSLDDCVYSRHRIRLLTWGREAKQNSGEFNYLLLHPIIQHNTARQ